MFLFRVSVSQTNLGHLVMVIIPVPFFSLPAMARSKNWKKTWFHTSTEFILTNELYLKSICHGELFVLGTIHKGCPHIFSDFWLPLPLPAAVCIWLAPTPCPCGHLVGKIFISKNIRFYFHATVNCKPFPLSPMHKRYCYSENARWWNHGDRLKSRFIVGGWRV